MSDTVKTQTPSSYVHGDVVGLAEKSAEYESDSLTKRETLELVKAYYGITDPSVRKRVYELAKALADAADGGEK